MQFEAAKTAAIRSTATAKRLAHDEIGAPDTARWNAVSALSVRFETLTIFVSELNKAGASDEIRYRFTNENCAGWWHSSRKPGQFTKRLIRRKMHQSVDHLAARMSWAACSSLAINALLHLCVYGKRETALAPLTKALAKLEGL